ncbi:DMP19 family protein [Adhaeribacter rhizoryzae]|uniref:DUF4375 domain-containing protein n=1 Tax=Adhaeribacter rhizoryzae TaxID=2607907 RepID=A0A5M6CV84_9BACT|nr:DUF4375 domain-containing protein [Adhaeribacter rhizoryzae]KAA5538963.1 DUF4375 domain-containing protein [Adhaeribacter rhizoryzae]
MVEVQIMVNEQTIRQGDVFKIIEPLWWTVDIYQSKAIYDHGLKQFSENQKYVFAIRWYLAEVNNGAHHQFFSNATGIVWQDALQGLQKVELPDSYEILKEAIDGLGGNPSFNRQERKEQLAKSGVDFENLDHRFYITDKIMGIEARLLSFIEENKTDFYFEGQITKPKKA